MTEKEKFMYQVMSKISEADAPIVFKGAMVTKLILAESDYTVLDRQTKDIDANWVGAPPSMSALVETINESLRELQNQFYAAAYREYGEKTSAGVWIRKRDTDEEIIMMDISMKPVAGSRLYYYGEAGIRGVLANEILADKLTVMSKRLIFRRAKDIIDVYALAHCVKVTTPDIYEIFKQHPAREVGVFDEFYNRRADVEYAYNRLAGIEGKPDFADVCAYLNKFVEPFAKRDETPKFWNSDKLE